MDNKLTRRRFLKTAALTTIAAKLTNFGRFKRESLKSSRHAHLLKGAKKAWHYKKL